MKVKENKKAPLFKLSGTKNIKFDLKKIKGKLIVYFYAFFNFQKYGDWTGDLRKLFLTTLKKLIFYI